MRTDALIPLGLFALVLLGTLYFAMGGTPPLATSASGHAGLLRHLQAGEIDAKRASLQATDLDAVGLRILPLLDTDLTASFERPETREAHLALAHERDISERVVRTKIERLPTLVIAPKWALTMRLSGFAHPSLLADLGAVSQPFKDLDISPRDLIRPKRQMLTLVGRGALYRDLSVTLFAPQLFAPDLPEGCTSVIGGRVGHALIACETPAGTQVWALSDPDMLNNHGLSLGENAATARRLLPILAEGEAILLDTTTSPLRQTPRESQARDWSDLGRFFAWPFSLIWGTLAALLALALWRGGRRFGPVLRGPGTGDAAARETSIAAKARLLRASGDRRALIRAHMRTRVAELSRSLLGAADGAGTVEARLQAAVARRAPDQAHAFAQALYAATHPRAEASASDLLTTLAQFEAACEKVTHDIAHDLGRA